MKRHEAAHKLAQAYLDLIHLEHEINAYDQSDRKHRAMCFIHNAQGIVQDVLDRHIGPKLVEKPVDVMA